MYVETNNSLYSQNASYVEPVTVINITEDDLTLRDCTHIFGKPLQIIYNLSLAIKAFPGNMNNGSYMSSLKSGARNCISNYRPVDILSNFAKAIKISLYDKIFFQIKYRIIPQHVFFSQRSTITNLSSFLQIFYNRTGLLQYVEYYGYKSPTFVVTSVALQGSNLAQLIFSNFVNHIVNNIISNLIILQMI